MTEEQNALKIFEEELGEFVIELLILQQHISKAMRFGVHDKSHVDAPSNKEQIETEWNDVLASITFLKTVGIDIQPNVEAITTKMSKIEKYTNYSKSIGTVI